MTTDARSGVALLERHHREANERASSKYFWASAVSCSLALLTILVLCFAGQLHQIPWQAYLSVAGVVSGIVLQLWKAYFTAESCVEACQEKLHEQVCANEVGVSGRRSAH